MYKYIIVATINYYVNMYKRFTYQILYVSTHSIGLYVYIKGKWSGQLRYQYEAGGVLFSAVKAVSVQKPYIKLH